MESSVHLLKISNRHLSHSLLLRRSLISIPKNTSSINFHYNPIPNFKLNFPNSIPRKFPNPFTVTGLPGDHRHRHHFASIFSNPNTNLFKWHSPSSEKKDQQNGVSTNKEPLVTAVLLGWLGSKQKHLRRYVDLYTSKGIHVITFVASVGDVLSFDLGSKLEERISHLSNEIANWVSKSENDGRERKLVFHTFSNTGWLAYGAILDNLGRRQGFLEKIIGCIVDSGGDPNLDPKVWAAGFTAALLKKHSSFAYPSVELSDKVVEEKKKPLLIETLLFFTFENLFSYLLGLPNINQRLMKIIYALKNQPCCPQLYLYSTADKVIPFKSVEPFIEEQRRKGIKVFTHNFISSPHVDHFRTFPSVYASGLEYFLKGCMLVAAKS